MFCPNCGTKNADTAQTCTKCNFHLKSAAAPKFKGTMLMMNQPGGAAPAAPAPPRPAAGAPPAGATGGPPSKLKGTMVGVAPPNAGGAAPSPVAVPPAMGGPAAPSAPMTRPQTPFGAAPPAAPAAVQTPAPMPAPPPPAPPAFEPPMAAAPPPVAPPPAAPEPAAAFNAPGPGGPVNALAGTMAADAATFAAVFPGGQAAAAQAQAQQPPPGGPNYGAPQPNYGGPPPNYGAPPMGGNVQGPTTAMPAMGDPAAFGAPPGGMPNAYGAPMGGPMPGGGMPQPYGQAPQQPYGAPPGAYAPQQPPPGAYGQPQMQQPMMGYGQAPGAIQAPGPGMLGTLQSAGNTTGGPTKRNALMTFLLPGIVIFGGGILGSVLAYIWAPLGLLSSLFGLAGMIMYLLSAIKMANEIKSVTRNASFAWWPIFIPIYNYYWLWIMVPAEVTKAKQMMGVQQPTRSIVLYIFLWHFALASDINDMAR